MPTVQEALANLQRTTESPLLVKLGTLFTAAGYELSLVGGPVRDAFLGRETNDLDFTTSANPDEILSVLKGNVDAHWDIGRDLAQSVLVSAIPLLKSQLIEQISMTLTLENLTLPSVKTSTMTYLEEISPLMPWLLGSQKVSSLTHSTDYKT